MSQLQTQKVSLWYGRFILSIILRVKLHSLSIKCQLDLHWEGKETDGKKWYAGVILCILEDAVECVQHFTST